MLGHTSIIGYAGRDAELRYTTQGKPYCQFSVGMTEYYKADGERREKLTWYGCKLWGARAENISKYIKKGTHLFVEGRCGAEAYLDKETGDAKSVITISASRVQLLDKRGAGSESVIESETGDADAADAEAEGTIDAGSATPDDWLDKLLI